MLSVLRTPPRSLPARARPNRTQIALRLQLGPLESVICEAEAHVFRHEAGGIAYHARATAIPVVPRGPHLRPADIEPAILEPDIHHATTRLIALENTLHGHVVPEKDLASVRALCDRRKLRLHLDGARLWNAMAATGASLRQYARHCDTLSICLRLLLLLFPSVVIVVVHVGCCWCCCC